MTETKYDRMFVGSEVKERQAFLEGLLDTHYSGRSSATFTIAAADATWPFKADEQCKGNYDDEVIQAAIAATPSSGGEIQLSEGTFRTNVAIVMNKPIKLNGCSGWSTLIQPNNDTDCDVIQINGGGTHIYFPTIMNMQIHGNKDNQTTGGYGICGIGDYSDSIIQNVFVLRCKKSGIYHTDSWYNQLNRVWVEYCEGEGVYLETSDFVAMACRFSENGENGVLVKTSKEARIIGSSIDKNKKNGVRIFEGVQGMYIGGCAIDNNSYENAGNYSGIVRDGGAPGYNYAISIIGNAIGSPENDTQKYGIDITDYKAGLVITGNTIFKEHTGKIHMGASDAGDPCMASIIKNNSGLSMADQMDYEYMTNGSGGDLTAGTVVVYKAVPTLDEFTTTIAQGNDMVTGVLAEDIANNAEGRVLTEGKTTLMKVNGIVDIVVGNYLGTFTEAGIAMKAAAGDMAIAIAMEAYAGDDSNGVIDALVVKPRKI